jgi:hypothetical protein
MRDLDLLAEELEIAKREGIACIVDGGHPDMGRDIGWLRQLSSKSGMPIVAGGGFYAQPFYPRIKACNRLWVNRRRRVSPSFAEFRDRHGRTCFDTGRGRDQLLVYVRRSQPSAAGGINSAAGAPSNRTHGRRPASMSRPIARWR